MKIKHKIILLLFLTTTSFLFSSDEMYFLDGKLEKYNFNDTFLKNIFLNLSQENNLNIQVDKNEITSENNLNLQVDKNEITSENNLNLQVDKNEITSENNSSIQVEKEENNEITSAKKIQVILGNSKVFLTKIKDQSSFFYKNKLDPFLSKNINFLIDNKNKIFAIATPSFFISLFGVKYIQYRKYLKNLNYKNKKSLSFFDWLFKN